MDTQCCPRCFGIDTMSVQTDGDKQAWVCKLCNTSVSLEWSMFCNQCGEQMNRVDADMVLTSNPPLYPWNWECPYKHVTIHGGTRSGKLVPEENE